ncbi:MAG: FG-GAP repeat domain-containing protein [Phycisphaerales bacterium]
MEKGVAVPTGGIAVAVRLRRAMIALGLLCMSTTGLAQTACLPDTEGDGHPLFANPAVVTGWEGFIGPPLFSHATSFALGDLNGDGNADAVVTNVKPPVQAYYLSVLMGRGDGVFEQPVIYPGGRECTHVELADFDGDGDLDCAVANGFDDTVSLFPNLGDGTLGPRTDHRVGDMPRSVKIADFNHDGRPDVASLNTLSNDLSMLINSPSGGLFGERRIPVVGGVTQRGDSNLNFPYPGPFLDGADFDGDGDIDLAIPSGSKARILLNDGAANFTPGPVLTSAGGSEYAIVAADLSGDGRPDLASCGTWPTASVWLNLGAGQWSAATGYEIYAGFGSSAGTAVYYPSVAAGDADGDGDIDLLFGEEFRKAVVLLRNQGGGTFATKELTETWRESWFVRLGRLGRSARVAQVVITNGERGTLRVIHSEASGRFLGFEQQPRPSVGVQGSWRAVGLLSAASNDRRVVVTAYNSPQLRIFSQLPNGSLVPTFSYGLGGWQESCGEFACVGDLNADARADVVLLDTIVIGGYDRPGKVWIFPQLPNGEFAAPVPYLMGDSFPTDAELGDIDRDGDIDVVIRTCQIYQGSDPIPIDRRVLVYRNNGNGTCGSPEEYLLGKWPIVSPQGSVGLGRVDDASTWTSSPPRATA